VAADLTRVYRCLEELDSEARIALVLHRVDGLSIPDVAAQMSLSISTVKRRIKVAEEVLARFASEDGRSR
jgi:DNA-directed RNA polymerase specialized sigma24 family protein